MSTKKPEEEQWTPGVPVNPLRGRDVHMPAIVPLADVPPDVLAEIGTKGAAAESGDLVPLRGAAIDERSIDPMPLIPSLDAMTGTIVVKSETWSVVHVITPHVATLPDGTRLNIPAGTTMREGSDGQQQPVRFFDLANSLRAAFERVDEAMFYGDVEKAHAGWEALKTEMVAQEKINAPVRVETPADPVITIAADLAGEVGFAFDAPDLASPGVFCEIHEIHVDERLRAGSTSEAKTLANVHHPESQRNEVVLLDADGGPVVIWQDDDSPDTPRG